MPIEVDLSCKYPYYSLTHLEYTDLLIILTGLKIVSEHIKNEQVVNSAKSLINDITSYGVEVTE